MMGNATMLLDVSYLRLRDYLGLAPIPPVRSGTSANYYDERILEHFDIDFAPRLLGQGAGQHDRAARRRHLHRCVGRALSRNVGIFVNAVEHRCAMPPPSPRSRPTPAHRRGSFSAAGVRGGLPASITTPTTPWWRNPLSPGFLDRSCNLTGMAEFFMLMVDAPGGRLHARPHPGNLHGRLSRFPGGGGPVCRWWRWRTIWAPSAARSISPAMFRRFIKPREQQLYAMIHELAPDAFIIHHTDGNVFAIIPDLIEAGVNVLNPVQTSSRDMSAQTLKDAYGDRLASRCD